MLHVPEFINRSINNLQNIVWWQIIMLVGLLLRNVDYTIV